MQYSPPNKNNRKNISNSIRTKKNSSTFERDLVDDQSKNNLKKKLNVAKNNIKQTGVISPIELVTNTNENQISTSNIESVSPNENEKKCKKVKKESANTFNKLVVLPPNSFSSPESIRENCLNSKYLR
ncbi:Hypothetical protein SRAE_2000212800 [Strongyloides ratti]|uniref:Uncharacterized protein n=1 Tax=Strongyloides ratti TaxID=34506 RepID=A0A090LIX6_STRRB|nr:Hypothetical protein SRAE_2000212800 [Strongyloides ratti]CEF67465.1 Hypothetical protein SRAE_2000212800 [Strongyloides ratti]